MFSSWFATNKSRKLIGLEIGSNHIKLLKIDSTQTPYCVEKLSVSSLPPGAVVKDEIKNINIVSDTIRDMIRDADITTKDVAIAIPRSATIIKSMTIDGRLNQDDIESRAWVEANRHFPDLVGDIYLDFAELGPLPQDKTMREYVLVACRKDQIKPYQEVLKLAGLNAKIIDVDSFALQRALAVTESQTKELKTTGLLNLNLNLSMLVVVDHDNLIYAHDQSFDGNRLMTELQSIEDEQLCMTRLKESISPHLRHAMHFFSSSRPNITIQKLIISGDCAIIPGIDSVIKQDIGIDVCIANPFLNMKVSPYVNVDELKRSASTLMLCCGLALSKVDGS